MVNCPTEFACSDDFGEWQSEIKSNIYKNSSFKRSSDEIPLIAT